MFNFLSFKNDNMDLIDDLVLSKLTGQHALLLTYLFR